MTKRQAQEPHQQKPRPHGNIRTQFSNHSKSQIPQHTGKEGLDLKSYLMVLIEGFKKDLNSSLKETQENISQKPLKRKPKIH